MKRKRFGKSRRVRRGKRLRRYSVGRGGTRL